MRYSIRNEYRSRIVTRKYIHRLEYIDFRIPSIPPPTAFPWYDPFHDEGCTNQASQENLIVTWNPLQAVDPNTLEILWSGEGSLTSVSLSSDNKYIYTTGYNSDTDMYTVDLYDYNGNKVVSHDIEPRENGYTYAWTLLTNNRLVYLGSSLYIIDRASLPSTLNIISSLSNYNYPVVTDLSNIYATYGNFPNTTLEIHKLDEDGNIIAQSSGATDSYELIHGIALSDDRIFYDRTNYGVSLYICALDKNTLDIIGCVDLQKEPQSVDQIIYYNGYVYVSYHNKIPSGTEIHLCKIDASNLDIIWDITLESTGFDFIAISTDETIFLGAIDLYAINPDGTIKWSINDLNVVSFPIITPSGKLVIVCLPDNYYYIKIYDVDTGSEIGSIKGPSNIDVEFVRAVVI